MFTFAVNMKSVISFLLFHRTSPTNMSIFTVDMFTKMV